MGRRLSPWRRGVCRRARVYCLPLLLTRPWPSDRLRQLASAGCELLTPHSLAGASPPLGFAAHHSVVIRSSSHIHTSPDATRARALRRWHHPRRRPPVRAPPSSPKRTRPSSRRNKSRSSKWASVSRRNARTRCTWPQATSRSARAWCKSSRRRAGVRTRWRCSTQSSRLRIVNSRRRASSKSRRCGRPRRSSLSLRPHGRSLLLLLLPHPSGRETIHQRPTAPLANPPLPRVLKC